MQIRTKLTLRFSLIVAAILILSSIAIYYFQAEHREQDFYKRLRDSAISTGRLFIEVDEVDEKLMRIISQNTNSLYEEQVVIYSGLNEKIYDSRADTFTGTSREDILNKVRKQGEVRFTEGQRESIGVLHDDHSESFVIVASAFDKYGWRKVANLRIVLLIVMLIATTLTVFAGWFFSGQALDPISRVVKEVDIITDQNLDSRVNEGNGNDEIAKLAITFNNMLARLEDSFRMQTSFVSNASHELRTPLTAMSGQMEVSLMKERTVEEYKLILQSVLEETRGMIIVTNRLLDMAKASSDISKISFSKLRIDDLLWQAREDLIRRTPEYKVSIRFSELPEEESRLIVMGNENLVKAAFYNLMENACKYSDNDEVIVTMTFEDENLKICFIDTGRGISEDDLEKIFEPFYRADNARDKKGHGLGLSLTQKILQLHRGDIHITSQQEKGTTVEVWLPHI